MLRIKFLGLMVVLFTLSAHATPHTGKNFDHAIFVIFENTNYANAVKQPFFKELADSGTLFTNFLALTHPSQGNYVALTSGSLNGVQNDKSVDINSTNVVDLLEAKGLTWKVYAEDYPGNCFTGKSNGNYVRKHNPFISYLNIQKNASRCANIVDSAEFDKDAASDSLPNYIFYIPGLKEDGHDTGAAYADQWYRQRFSPFLKDAKFMADTILISTFDESGISMKNQIYTSIVGPSVKPGLVSDALDIYSLLILIEDNWDLGNLGKADAKAAPMPNIWR